MSTLVVVTGATGGQGGSVIRALQSKPGLRLRGLSRNPDGAAAKELASQGVEMVQADLDDVSTLQRAFEGAQVIFAVTDFYETMRAADSWTAMNVEYQRGINIAEAASRTGSLEHFIWSTLPSAHKISKKQYFVPHFEAKAKVDDFIKSKSQLLAKTTFYWVSFFGENLQKPTFAPLYLSGLKKYVIVLPTAPSCPVGFIGDHRTNIGIYIAAIIEQRSRTLGKYVFGNVETVPLKDYYDIWASVVGRTVEYLQVSNASYCELLPNYGQEMSVMLNFWNKYGADAWSGEDTLTDADLGITKQLIGLRESIQNLDWTSTLAQE
ncbi:uncharacterized protein Z520_00763 [Fonsecaea multimorphosa CBS 102226]|uniref:NmrA-like domain-containing protein n=1 Tax=Fonsecaea multimorphosa CBS 102226 TaxID=1442371 RepID=A0A0D2HQB6_9EURO|nr:uncharacterized protein Z520_00763 [Fonsecaea multimorphosa CBS 102226]KIY04071.1 hypothetical protein Z520_00763 [Fonsecaea multimorphosa CBS 102226]OAL31906.1 hypothetical protein AYO22_00776 [Fonsecaea multimorphosa]